MRKAKTLLILLFFKHFSTLYLLSGLRSLSSQILLFYSFTVQCTLDIVATFIVVIRIKSPLVLVQNTFILLYSDRI